MNWWKSKKVNPLKSNTELAAEYVEFALNRWAGVVDEREVINIVLERKLPGTSVHGKPYSKNPKSILKGEMK